MDNYNLFTIFEADDFQVEIYTCDKTDEEHLETFLEFLQEVFETNTFD